MPAQFLNLEDELLDLLGKVEIVNFREAMKEVRSEDYDIAFIEGSITTHADIEEVKKIREHTKILIAFGACATIGGINAIKNFQPLEKVRKYVYGDKWEAYDTVPTMAVKDVVKVDYSIHGCPVSKKEILERRQVAPPGQGAAHTGLPRLRGVQARGERLRVR